MRKTLFGELLLPSRVIFDDVSWHIDDRLSV